MTQDTLESCPEVVVDLNEKKPLRVLHVDDEPILLKIAKQCLEMQGPFQVDTVSSVEEALEKLKKETYDAVVSDFQMPGKDGLEFLKELRQDGNNISFMMLTGRGREEVAIKALNLGADQYLNKTGDPETVYCELGYAIRRTVEKRKAETALESLGERYRRLFESAVEGVVINGSDGNILSLNRAAANILGYNNREELIGRPAVELYADPAVRARLLEELVERGCVKDRELTWKKKDGTLISILASVTVQKDEKGNLLRTEGIIRDVTEKKKAEKALKESEEKYKTLVEQSLQGVLVAQGPVPRIVFANATMSKILGYTPEEMISFSPQQTLELVHPDDRELFFGRFKDRLEGNSPPSNYMIRGVRKDGTIVWLELSSSRIDYDGRPAAQAMFMDITERKKAEECLRQSEEKFRTIVENSQDVIMLTKPDGIISYLSPSCSRVLGYDPEDLVGKQPWIIHPDDLEDVKKVHYQALKGLNGSMEYRILTKAGETRWVHHSWSSLMTNSQLQLIISVVKDISERKKAEEDLRESEGRYKDLFESIQDPVGIFVGREGRLIDYNTAFKRSCGYTDEELKDKAFLDFVHPDDHALVLQKYQTEYSEEELPLVYEIRGTNKKGESLPLELSVSTYKKKGRVVGIEVIHRDMTERKHYERSLSGLNIHSRKLNTAKNMEEIYELTLNAAEKTLGFEFADIFMVKGKMLQLVTHRGKTKISSLTLPMDGDKGITIRAARTGKPVLVPDISKEEAYVEGEEGGRSELAVPIKFGPRVLGVLNVESKELDAFNKKDQELLEILASHAATAISNLDRARELETYSREIQETKHKFEGLFLGNPEATIYLDPDFRILDVNPRFEELFGDSLSEIKGKCIDDVIVPENMIEEAEMLDKKAVEGYVYHNTFRMRKDGSLVPVSISAAPILIQGQLAGYIGVYKDISELKKTERDLAIMNEKLRVVGGLTRHDVRNKLSAITGNSYLLKKQLAGNSEALDKLGDMETAVQQAVRIFEFARTYEMLGAEELAYINVEKSVSEAVSLFSDLKGAKVINDCRGLCVLADSLLRQLFYNLIDNSLKYGQRTTQIRIHYEKTRDDQLKLIYKDDGIGISEDVRPKLFTEGFTTGRGSGYGLYFIKKMVEVYGWIIEETGGPGKGAQFVMTIPRMNPNGKENYKTV